MPVLLLFILYILAEIGVFVLVGDLVGVLGVFALVIGSGVLGVAMLRGRLARIGGLLRAGAGSPETLLGQGALTGIGALLLIMPGLLGDALGLALLLPPVQRLLVSRMSLRMAGGARWQGEVYEEAVVVEDAETVEPETAPGAADTGRRRLDRPAGS